MTTALAALAGAKLEPLRRVSSAAAKHKAAAAELDKAKGSAKVKAEAKYDGAAALLDFMSTGKAKRSVGKKGMATRLLRRRRDAPFGTCARLAEENCAETRAENCAECAPTAPRAALVLLDSV